MGKPSFVDSQLYPSTPTSINSKNGHEVAIVDHDDREPKEVNENDAEDKFLDEE